MYTRPEEQTACGFLGCVSTPPQFCYELYSLPAARAAPVTCLSLTHPNSLESNLTSLQGTLDVRKPEPGEQYWWHVT